LKGAQKKCEVQKAYCHLIPEHGVQDGGQQRVQLQKSRIKVVFVQLTGGIFTSP